MASVKTMVEARRIVWERACATINNDLDVGDWLLDDYDDDEESAKRLIKATKQVVKSIEKRLARMKKKK